MINLKATIRETGKQNDTLREQGFLPAILYGEGLKSISLQVDIKEFEQIYEQAGESSLIELEVDKKKHSVLIHQTAHDPLTDEFLHVDFFHPSTKKKVGAEIPLVFEGESLAVKNLGGILVRELQSIDVKGLAHQLPREIKVDLNELRTLEDKILVKDLSVPEAVEIQRDANDIVAHITLPAKMEEDLKPEKDEEGDEDKEDKEETGVDGEEKPAETKEKSERPAQQKKNK